MERLVTRAGDESLTSQRLQLTCAPLPPPPCRYTRFTLESLIHLLVFCALGGLGAAWALQIDRHDALAEHEATFAAAPDWVDAFLALTCEPPHCAMLRAARAESRALLLIDGLLGRL